jgi:hypothetical protein
LDGWWTFASTHGNSSGIYCQLIGLLRENKNSQHHFQMQVERSLGLGQLFVREIGIQFNDGWASFRFQPFHFSATLNIQETVELARRGKLSNKKCSPGKTELHFRSESKGITGISFPLP